jgi:hypothetical protein
MPEIAWNRKKKINKKRTLTTLRKATIAIQEPHELQESPASVTGAPRASREPQEHYRSATSPRKLSSITGAPRGTGELDKHHRSPTSPRRAPRALQEPHEPQESPRSITGAPRAPGEPQEHYRSLTSPRNAAGASQEPHEPQERHKYQA